MVRRSMRGQVHYGIDLIEHIADVSSSPDVTRALIFSPSSNRDKEALLQAVRTSLILSGIQPQHVIFTTYKRRHGDQRGIM